MKRSMRKLPFENTYLVSDAVSSVIHMIDKFSAKIVPQSVLNMTLRGICLRLIRI
jgi:hypothetical protein